MDARQYQQNREQLLNQLLELKGLYDNLHYSYPAFFKDMPAGTVKRFRYIDRDISRLRNRDLVVAFLGGFNSGKSSLLNAFLGDYLLPESPDITTAVPTYVRYGDEAPYAKVHYLNPEEIEELEELYRAEIATTFEMPELRNATSKDIFKKAKAASGDGTGNHILNHFALFLKQKQKNGIAFSSENRERYSIAEMQQIVQDETRAMFLDRVEIFTNTADIPPDVVLVDLPGISVPNPRHRQVTSRFVTNDAHAIIFVLMATRLFDRDENAIMEKIRAGESRIAEKTFWVLNRWDALNPAHQADVISTFRQKMAEFSIGGNYRYYTTNALHGLLSQLGEGGEIPPDTRLSEHLHDYQNQIESGAIRSHEAAAQKSQIPKLRSEVLSFLNDRIRETTLNTARENTEQNFCQPLMHHLHLHKQADEGLLDGELKFHERTKTKKLTDEQLQKQIKELEKIIGYVVDKVVTERRSLFADEAKELEKVLREEIKDGKSTNAFEVYKQVIGRNQLRKYPYYFEIEIHVVDSLNSILKQRFREIAENQVKKVAEALIGDVRSYLETLNADVGYDPTVATSFKELILGIEGSFHHMVDSVVRERAPLLDELLVYKPGRFWGFWGKSNAILNGLEKAARMHNQQIFRTDRLIMEKDMKARTRKIRSTLENHYVQRTNEFRDEVADAVWLIVRDKMRELEDQIKEVMQQKYLPILEYIKSQEIKESIQSEKESIEIRARKFREAIDRIEQISRRMRVSNDFVFDHEPEIAV